MTCRLFISYYALQFPFNPLLEEKKSRGIEIQLGSEILITFTYILFMQVSTTFATNSNLQPALAVWIPNFCYIILAGVLLYKAPK